MKEVVIASAVRTPVGKAYKGTLRATRPDELGSVAIKGALERVPQVDKREIEDVIIGCAMPEGEQGMNVARIASLRAGLPVEAGAMTKDLALLVGDHQGWLTTEGFLDKVAENLDAALAG